MTTTITSRDAGSAEVPSNRAANVAPWVAVAAATIVAVLGRLPFLTGAASSDEGGFLILGREWRRAGTSLYGNYWVDRPPLLLLVFGFAADHGGLVALRIVGCVAVALTVVACAWVANVVAGPAAAPWAAAVAAALSYTPMVDGLEVNGELLAAPLIAVGFGCVLMALGQRIPPGPLSSGPLSSGTPQSGSGQRAVPSARGAVVWATVAGAAGTAAVLIKQNMIDVFVFAVVAVVAAVLLRQSTWRRGLLVIGAGVVGSLVVLAVIAAITVSRGTSLHGVYFAMYPFRLKAGDILATYGYSHALPHLFKLVGAATASGMLAMLALGLIDTVARRPRQVVSFALTAVVLFDVVSIAGGGSYWLHYLIEAGPAVAVWAGLLARRGAPGAKLVVVWMVVASLLSVSTDPRSAGSGAQVVGTAIAASAQPSDTIVVVWGHPDVVYSSGLSSPYPYLWSLPAKTLDPDARRLGRLLSGPDRPTWLVTWYRLHSWGVNVSSAVTTVQHGYRLAGRVCGRTVYVRNDVRRSPLPKVSDCSRPASAGT